MKRRTKKPKWRKTIERDPNSPLGGPAWRWTINGPHGELIRGWVPGKKANAETVAETTRKRITKINGPLSYQDRQGLGSE